MGPRSNGNPHARGLSVQKRQGEQNPEAEPPTSGWGLAPEQYLPVSSQPQTETEGASSQQQLSFWSSSNILTTSKGTWYPQVGTIQFYPRGKRKTSHLRGEASNTWPPSSQCRRTFLPHRLQTSHQERLGILPARQMDVDAA